MDFKLEPFGERSHKFDYSAHNKEETFERTCIRTLNKLWLPNLSFNKLESIFLEEQPDNVLNYDWYSSKLFFSNAPAPELTFFKLKKAWSLDLHTLLKSDIRKQELYKRWEEQPSDGFVFPLIGSQAIIYESCYPPDFNCVIQKRKDNFLIISLLKDYATLFKEATFNVG